MAIKAIESTRFSLAKAVLRLSHNWDICAMVRARNEEEFLYPSVASIAGLVDEIVLVDNASTDRTAEIIERLRAEHPGKIRAYRYEHRVLRVGKEHWDQFHPGQLRPSPQLTSSYYNWCLGRCARRFVLKWDADMVALPAFSGALEQWRQARRPLMVFGGQNVHPDRRRLIRARVTEREPLLAGLSVPALPIWATSLTRDFAEPRLFPRALARYGTKIRWTQQLESPFQALGESARLIIAEPCYLHMKFCKRDPFNNYSPDLARVIAANVAAGSPLDEESLQTLRRHDIDRAASRDEPRTAAV